MALSALAWLPAALGGSARAEDALGQNARPGAATSCRFGGGAISCSNFQGYIVVGHGRISGAGTAGAADGSNLVEPDPDAPLGPDRLYLGAGMREER